MIWVWFALVVVLTTVLVVVARRGRLTEARLVRMESRLAAVLEGPDAGLSVWNPDGRLTGFNQRFKEFYPDAPLKPGVVFEDLVRYTANRGLVRVPEEEVEQWVSDWVNRFGTAAHQVFRTPDGRWLDVHTRVTDAGEVLLLYSDTTDTRETEANLSDRGEQLARHSADLGLLADVIQAGGTASSTESAAAQMIELVCSWSGWPVGYAYRVETTGEHGAVALALLASWYADDDAPDRFTELRASMNGETASAGDGLAGRARQSGRLVWVPNVAVDPTVDPDRATVLMAAGLRGACAVPVGQGEQVVAVLEFLSAEQLTPDPTATRLLEATAMSLATVLTSRNAA